MLDVEPTMPLSSWLGWSRTERRERWHGVWKIEFLWPLLVITGLLEVPRKLVFSLAHGDYYMDVRSFCFQWWWLKNTHSAVVHFHHLSPTY